MYEHPSLSYQVTEFEREQMERAVERRRMILEHADQIVPRPAGALRRTLRRLFGGATAGAPAPVLAGRGSTSCEPVAAR